MIETPIRAPRANAFAERWVRTVRTECLDWILVVGRHHLERVLLGYAFSLQRREGRIEAWAWRRQIRGPIRSPGQLSAHPLRRRDVLGGLIHEYEPAA